MKLLFFLSYILYCFYIGVLLIFLPWSPLWDSNGLVALFPPLRALLLAGTTRGAVSGLGVLLFCMGLADAWHFIRFGRDPERARRDAGGRH